MSNSRDHVAVVGGGVIGAMCAWYLSGAGHQVTIIEKEKFGAACSHGNCGYISPSHVLPLPAPGAITSTLKGMLSPDSPFYVKPRMSPTLWKWLASFARRCNHKDMLEAGHARHALLQSSRRLYEELIEGQALECEWQEDGLLFVQMDEHEFEHYAQVDKLLTDTFGVSAKPYAGDELLKLEPSLKPGIAGAWHYECDAWLRPDRLLTAMRAKLEERGVTILESQEVKSFNRNGPNAKSIFTKTDEIPIDAAVVATGALAPFLNEHLGCRIPIQPGKGYSLTMPRPGKCPRLPMIFEQHRVAITPMQSGYRIGSTMEFAGYDTSINRKRLGMLKDGASHYLHEPHCDPVEAEWFGWRPMTYDGKPFIDRSPAMDNVWVAAGHNMLGLSMATGTGRLIRELVDEETPHVDPQPYSLSRI